MATRKIQLSPLQPDPSFRPKKTDTLLLSDDRFQIMQNIAEKYKNLVYTDNFYRSFADTLNSFDNSQTELVVLLKGQGAYLFEGSENSSFVTPFLRQTSDCLTFNFIENERALNEIFEMAEQPLQSFCARFNEIKDKAADFITLREKFLSRAAKVLEMNKDKKIILAKLQIIEVERDEIGKELDKSASFLLSEILHLIQATQFDFIGLISGIMELRANYFLRIAEKMRGLNMGIMNIRDLIQESKQPKLREQKKWVGAALVDKPSRTKPGTLASNPALLRKYALGLEFPLEFTVREGGDKKKSIAIVMSTETRSIQIAGRKHSPNDILQIVREKQGRLRFVFRDSSLDSKLIFPSEVESEKCLEAYWLLKDGLDRPSVGENVSMKEEIKIVCGTWNMGDAAPSYDGPLETWMPRGYDIYVTSLQEADYSPRAGFESCEDDFYHWILRHLGDGFLKLASTNLMGIRICVFIKREHYYKITNVKKATVATGIGNILGNKGGVAIAFNLYDTSFCFMGSHLAARIDRGRLATRNQNYRDIVSRMPFSQPDIHNEFDHLFWVGDLNYRVELDRNKIIELSAQENWAALHEHDQLIAERSLGNCFFQFVEHSLEFKPTYRYDRGTREWSDEKMREPAYCDRVLWKSVYPTSVTPLRYQPAHGLMTSDHSPLFAGFSVLVDYPSLPHDRKCNCRILFSKIQLYDCLDKGLRSDLQLRFEAPWLTSSSARSSGSSSGTVPTWETHVYLSPNIGSPDFLVTKWVRIIVQDKNNISLSSTTVPLTNAYPAQKAQHHLFDVPLSEKGTPWGRLKGYCQIMVEEPLLATPQEKVETSNASLFASYRSKKANTSAGTFEIPGSLTINLDDEMASPRKGRAASELPPKQQITPPSVHVNNLPPLPNQPPKEEEGEGGVLNRKSRSITMPVGFQTKGIETTPPSDLSEVEQAQPVSPTKPKPAFLSQRGPGLNRSVTTNNVPSAYQGRRADFPSISPRPSQAGLGGTPGGFQPTSPRTGMIPKTRPTSPRNDSIGVGGSNPSIPSIPSNLVTNPNPTSRAAFSRNMSRGVVGNGVIGDPCIHLPSPRGMQLELSQRGDQTQTPRSPTSSLDSQ